MPNHFNQTNFRLTLFATLLAFCVVVLGAYTRLTDAGLGCPDWPGCYGHLLVSQTRPETADIISATKAWTEMIHRYLAGLLGMVIFGLAILSIRNRHRPEQPLLLPIGLTVLVIFQALLGMWTVTLKLFPMVVIAHLLGGMTTLSLLWWLCLKFYSSRTESAHNFAGKTFRTLRFGAIFGLFILIIQIFLGGWTSANYAALVCIDFPFCQNHDFFSGNFWEAFNLMTAGVPGSPGTPLNYPARVTIHMAHRFGALITALVIGWIVFQVFVQTQSSRLRLLSIAITLLLMLQILFGITNILALLPLPIAVAHNAVAALLLLALITLNYYLHFKPRKK